eukprot:2317332-Amphidinium_carterae.1
MPSSKGFVDIALLRKKLKGLLLQKVLEGAEAPADEKRSVRELPAFTQAHLTELGEELQAVFNNRFVGKALTPNDAAAAASIGQLTADKFWSVLAQRSRFVKLGCFPDQVTAAAVAPVHPYYRVPPGIVLPWWADT